MKNEILIFAIFLISLAKSLPQSKPIENTKLQERLEPRDLAYDLSFGWFGANEDDAASNTGIKIASKIHEDTKTESVQSLLRALEEESKHADSEQQKSILNLIQDLNNVLVKTPERYAQILLSNVWHTIDMGAFGSTQRRREVMSAETFIKKLKKLLWKILELFYDYFSEEDGIGTQRPVLEGAPGSGESGSGSGESGSGSGKLGSGSGEVGSGSGESGSGSGESGRGQGGKSGSGSGESGSASGEAGRGQGVYATAGPVSSGEKNARIIVIDPVKNNGSSGGATYSASGESGSKPASGESGSAERYGKTATAGSPQGDEINSEGSSREGFGEASGESGTTSKAAGASGESAGSSERKQASTESGQTFYNPSTPSSGDGASAAPASGESGSREMYGQASSKEAANTNRPCPPQVKLSP